MKLFSRGMKTIKQQVESYDMKIITGNTLSHNYQVSVQELLLGLCPLNPFCPQVWLHQKSWPVGAH